MLGKKFDRLPVQYRVGLGQISHRFDQLPLTVNVARIGRPLASLAPYLRSYGDSENLGHKKNVRQSESFGLSLFSPRAAFWQYTVPPPVFQP